MTKVKIYTKSFCPYCKALKRLLDEKNVKYEEVDVMNRQDEYEELQRKTNHHTVPQVFIDDKFVGGFDDVDALDKSGELDKLLGE